MENKPDQRPSAAAKSPLKLKLITMLPVITVFGYFLWRATRY